MNKSDCSTAMDMAALAAQCLSYRPQQLTTAQLRNLATVRRMDAMEQATDTTLPCPTLMDVERADSAAMNTALNTTISLYEAQVERWVSDERPPTPAEAANDTRALLSVFFRTYRTAAKLEAQRKSER